MYPCSIFTDGSLYPKLKLGVGGFLFLHHSPETGEFPGLTQREVAQNLWFRRFENTSSADLEIQTLLWALGNFQSQFKVSLPGTLRIYTDSQAITGLLNRRAGLENRNFQSKKKDSLTNALLYRQYFLLQDQLGFEVIKVKGHSPSSTHDEVQRIFSYVDRAVRKELRLYLEEESKMGQTHE